jgi:glycosyltransferase involved in cell wall biosynthesis
LNIVLVNTDATLGGAAHACKRLWVGLRERGHHASLLAKRAEAESGVVVPIDPDPQGTRNHDRLAGLLRAYGVEQASAWHVSLLGPHFSLASHPLVQEAEVINLHWVTDFLSPRSVTEILALGKPVVWTLHDQRPFTGGCHYSGSCRQFEDLCRACPQFLPEFRPVAETCHEAAIACLSEASNLTIVTPSRWLAGEARRSAVFRGLRVESIANDVDINVFRPASSGHVRRRFGWPERAVVVLFGSHFVNDRRKGFDLVLSGVGKCMQNKKIASMVSRGELIFAAFGSDGDALLDFDLPIHHVGLMSTEKEMAELFQAADLFLCASRADNLPNTIMEAMGCGIPVLATSVGGIPEMVEDGANGRLCAPDDSDSLAATLADMLAQKSVLSGMGTRAREFCERNYAHGMQAQAYTSLFEELLKESAQHNSSRQSQQAVSALERAQAQVDSLDGEFRKRAGGIFQQLARKVRSLVGGVRRSLKRRAKHNDRSRDYSPH